MVSRKIALYQPFLPKSIGMVLKEIIESGWINEGKKVKQFEKMFRERFGFSHALTVNSCTSALRLSYAIARVTVGDEVITTPHTMAATSTAIMEMLATPVFADIQYETGNIDPKDIEHRITEKTKAIAIVHIAGYPCDNDKIYKIAKKYGLLVIEDCAHAIGGKYHGYYVGARAKFACFSFHTCKHITTGDGGMLVTNSDKIAKEARRRKWYGIDRNARFKPSILGYANYDVTELGYKYNMNDIAGAMGVEQMKYIDEIINRRMEIARFYRDELAKIDDIIFMEWKRDRVCANWLFPMHVKRRIKFCQLMRKKGIEVSIAFRRNDIYSIFGGLRKDLPNMDRFDKDIICIPIHCSLNNDDLHYIVKQIKRGW